MRQISSDLQAVQKVRSPRAMVSCVVEERGATRGLPAVAWRKLVDNAGQAPFRPCALIALNDGTVLRFVDTGTSVRQHTIADPDDPDNWTTPTDDSELLAHGALALAAHREPGTSQVVRLFYINANDGNVYYRQSNNGGSSWLATVNTVYSGGDAAADLVVLRQAGTGFSQAYFVGFSTFSGGVYRANFANGNTSSWTTWQYAVDRWRAAGVVSYRTGLTSGFIRVLVYRQRAAGQARLMEIRLDSSGNFDNERLIDRTSAGLVGMALHNYRFFQLLHLSNVMVGIGGESGFGFGAYEGVCGLFYDGELLVDETIMLPELATTASFAYTALCNAGNDIYVAGTLGVWRGAWQGAVTAEVLTPIQYDYDENVLDIDFPVTAGSMSLKVGQVLRLDRSLSWGAQTGTESVRFVIAKVSRGTDKVTVIAHDALGFLGSNRSRRPSIVSDGTGGVASVMRRVCGRIGIGVDVDATSLESAPVLGLSLMGGESLAGAAYRVGSQSEWYLVPSNDGSFRLTMMVPGDSDSGDYDDVPHEYGEAGNEMVVFHAAELADWRQLGFSQVLGTYSTDPQDGSALGMAAGAWVANTRPIAYSLTNRNYNSFATVNNAATAEGARQAKQDINAEMTSNANLALELYDIVEVTEPLLGWNAKQFRVRRIQERWEKGRLTQRVFMGTED